MSAHVMKEEIALRMPGSMAHYFRDEPMEMPADESPSLFARLGAAIRWVVELPQRRAVINELASLSDHELADIGLNRAELDMVFDRQFAASRAADRSELGEIRRAVNA
jgi:uncharacterized protein YjiS (DUF1127 family)